MTHKLGTTNSCLIELKNVLGTVNQAMEPRGDPTIATVLNQYSLSMHFKHPSLSIQISIFFTSHQ